MKAYVAVQRKLLVLIYILWKKDQEYISDYVVKKQMFRNQETEPSFALAQ
jgi:transposase